MPPGRFTSLQPQLQARIIARYLQAEVKQGQSFYDASEASPVDPRRIRSRSSILIAEGSLALPTPV